jgi:hypothetical protein
VPEIPNVVAPWHLDRLVFVGRRLREHSCAHAAEEAAGWWAV